MRLAIAAFALAACLTTVQPARAEYFVLRSGARLSVTGYQLVRETYKVQLQGGEAEIAAIEVVGIEREEVFASPAAIAPDSPPYAELIRASATRYGLDAELIASVIAAESNFDPRAVSRKNARGLMQLLPETAKRFGVRNILDPKENIDAGAHYLRDLLVRYQNNLALALAAYNAGPVRVKQFGRVPPYRETITYVRRIQAEYARRKASSASLRSASNGG